jgi:methylated-DNA-[protein]-cysteine S-methyltransferase
MIAAIAIDSPVGRLTVSATTEAIVAIGWRDEPVGDPNGLLHEARRQLEAYFAGQLQVFDLPLAPAGSRHDQLVWAAMRQIPRGQTRSYGELAMEAGSGPRAVGAACGRNPIPIVIPCHRVVARHGIGGYSGGAGLPTKRWLLQLEGGDMGSLASVGGARRYPGKTVAVYPV